MARDVFDLDDDIVDHETDGSDQPHELQIIEAVIQLVENCEGADQRAIDRTEANLAALQNRSSVRIAAADVIAAVIAAAVAGR